MNSTFMQLAIEQAKQVQNDVPVGAVIVKDGKIIARSHNLKETKQLVTAHAEILAIEKASKKINNWRLEDCELYVTLKPCKMCRQIIKEARIKHVYYGSEECLTNDTIKENYTYIESKECSKILKDFFKKLRENKHN